MRIRDGIRMLISKSIRGRGLCSGVGVRVSVIWSIRFAVVSMGPESSPVGALLAIAAMSDCAKGVLRLLLEKACHGSDAACLRFSAHCLASKPVTTRIAMAKGRI